MNNSDSENTIFSDLEDMDRKEIEQNVNDLERQIRTIEEEHKSLKYERKNQVEIVKSLRATVGEIESVNDERRGLLKKFHEARKLAENSSEMRDELNQNGWVKHIKD